MTSQDCRTDGEGRIKCATVSAADVRAVVNSYQKYFAYKIVADTIVSPDQAQAWGAHDMAGKRQVLMGPESGTEVYIRIVENDNMPDYEPLKSFGWNAIEITVKDVEALNEKLKDSPFDIVGKPALMDFSDKIKISQEELSEIAAAIQKEL